MLGLAQMAHDLACARHGGVLIPFERGPVPRQAVTDFPDCYPISAAYYQIIDHVQVAIDAYRYLYWANRGGTAGPVRVVL